MSQSLVIPKDTLQPLQLHEELLVRFPVWRGTPVPEGGFRDPSLQVEFTETQIRLTLPDEADLVAVRAVVTAHLPRPPKDWKRLRREAIAAIKTATNLSDDHLRALGFER